MKKFLAAMIIAVIAVAGVFATITVEGPTGVTLTYKINELWKPLIKLTADAYDSDTTGGKQVGTTGTFTTGTSNTFAAGSNVDSFAKGRVDFKIYDMTKFNSTEARSITISYTCSENWLKSDNTSAGVSIAKLNGGKISAASTTVDANGNNTTQTNDTNNLIITYAKGTIIDRTDSNSQVVGTFSVSWQNSNQLAAGDYHADVTLTMTSND